MTQRSYPTRKQSSLLVLLAVAAWLAGCSSRAKDEVFLESGKRYLAKKDYPRARLQFVNAVRANPKNAEAHYQLGALEMVQGFSASAYNEFDQALKLNPNHRDANIKMAMLLTTSEKPEWVLQAEERGRALLLAFPDDPEVLDLLAATEFRLRKPEEAQKLLERAASEAPHHLKTSVTLAMLKLQQHDSGGAEKALTQAVTNAPESIDAHLVLGALYLTVGKPTDAERQARWALQKDPNRAVALNLLAAALVSAGRTAEVEQTYRKLSRLSDATYRPLYGTYLLRNGKQKEAVAEFERLAKADPADRRARSLLVAAYAASNHYQEAERVLKDALDHNPKDTFALLQRAELRLRALSYDSAQKDLVEVLHYAPDSVYAHFLLASVRQAQGTVLLQRQELSEVLGLNPNFLPARIELARLYISEASPKTALDLLNQTPESERNDPAYLEYRNWALLAVGDRTAARKGVSQGLALARTRDFLVQEAVLRIEQGDHAGARKSLDEVLKSNPEDLGALRILLASYSAQKQLVAGINRVRAYAARRPQAANLQYLLGTLLAAQGDTNGARSAFTAVEAGDPPFAPARLALAQMDRKEGNLDAARTRLNALVSSKQLELPARLELGYIEATAGNYTKAVEHLRRVVVLDGNSTVALNNLAYLLADQAHQPDEALQYAHRARELAPDDMTVEGTLGWAYFQKGMYPAAVRCLQDAVRKEGERVGTGTAERRYHLAMAFLKNGDRELGVQTLNSAIKLNPNLPEAQIAKQMFDSNP